MPALRHEKKHLALQHILICIKKLADKAACSFAGNTRHAVKCLNIFLIFVCDKAVDRFTDLSAKIDIQIVEILNIFADDILDRLIKFRIFAFCEIGLSQIDTAVFLNQLIDRFAKTRDKAVDSLDDLSGFLVLRLPPAAGKGFSFPCCSAIADPPLIMTDSFTIYDKKSNPVSAAA